MSYDKVSEKLLNLEKDKKKKIGDLNNMTWEKISQPKKKQKRKYKKKYG